MNKAQKEKLICHIREKIEAQKKDIISYEQLTRPVSPDNAIGRLTRMEAISSKSISEAALRQARNTLTKLKQAFEIIDDPDFGLCSMCEEPIPFARLMAMPEATLCIGCAEKMGG